MTHVSVEQFSSDPDVGRVQFEEMAAFFADPAVRAAYEQEDRADTIGRYETPELAAQAAFRLQESFTMDGGPIRESGRVIGTWSTIEAFKMKVPDALLRTIGGFEIDYAAVDLNRAGHRTVVDRLMERRERVGQRVLALLPPATDETTIDLSVGIPLQMQTVGMPRVVRFPLVRSILDITYGLDTAGPLQLYESTHQYKRGAA
jgi:hypothetical protein